MRPLVLAFALVLAATGSWTAVARAAPDAGVAKARVLAEKAGDLLDDKKYAEALDAITQAEEAYHALTHLLMMAEAQQGLGRLAAAAATYERIATEPLPAGSPAAFRNAQETAKKRLQELLAHVPSVLVTVHGAPNDEVSATLDGAPYPLDSGVALRADPGVHTLRVSATGYKAVERSITLPEKGGVVTIDVTIELESKTASPDGPPRAVANRSDAARADAAPRPRGSKVPAYVAFALGGVGVVAGTVTGLLSMSKVSDLEGRCPGGRCAASNQSDIDSARTLGTVSTVGFGVGIVGIAVGVVLLITRGPSDAADHGPTARSTPWIGVGAAGFEGSFW